MGAPTKAETTKIKRSTVDEIRPHLGELIRMHWKELALDQDTVPLDPAWDVYEKLEQAGSLQALGAWVQTTLVGYSVSYLVKHHMHYRGHAYVQNDVFFVHPRWRGTRVGSLLMRAARRLAQEEGAAEMLWHVKPDTPMHAMLDRSKRHIVRDIIYSEKL